MNTTKDSGPMASVPRAGAHRLFRCTAQTHIIRSSKVNLKRNMTRDTGNPSIINCNLTATIIEKCETVIKEHSSSLL